MGGFGERIENLVLTSSSLVLKMTSSTSANVPAGSPSRDSQHAGKLVHIMWERLFTNAVIADENAKYPGYPVVNISVIRRTLRAAWTLTHAPFAQNGQVITLVWWGSNLILCVIRIHRGKTHDYT